MIYTLAIYELLLIYVFLNYVSESRYAYPNVLTFYTLKIYSLVDQKSFCGFFLPG